jgi:hypothetical protein
METTDPKFRRVIIIDGARWDRMQQEINEAIVLLNTATSKIAAHETNNEWELCDVIDYTDRKIRDARKLLENLITPI